MIRTANTGVPQGRRREVPTATSPILARVAGADRADGQRLRPDQLWPRRQQRAVCAGDVRKRSAQRVIVSRAAAIVFAFASGRGNGHGFVIGRGSGSRYGSRFATTYSQGRTDPDRLHLVR